MSKTTRLVVLVLMGAAALAAGCGSKKAKTPKEAVVNFYKAIEEGDKDLFMANVHVREEDKQLAEKTFDGMVAMINLRKKLEDEYGKEALGKAKAGGPMTKLTYKEIEAKVQIKEEGDKATATIPDGPETPPLVKKGDNWLVDLSQDVPTGEQREAMMKMFDRMQEAAKKAEEKIGKEGQTAEKIISEMMADIMGMDMQKMMKEMGEAMEKGMQDALKGSPED